MAYGIATYNRLTAPLEAYTYSPTSGTRPLEGEKLTKFLADADKARRDGTLPDNYIEKAGLEVRNNPKDGSVEFLEKFDDLELRDSEAKWAREHTSEARDRAYRNGDMETYALRAMLEFAKANPGHEDARSVDDIRKLAWRVRRNRDIDAAKRAAARLRAEGVAGATWEQGYIPTTTAMLKSTVSEYTPVNPNVRWTGMKRRDVPVREAVLLELNEAAKASEYSPVMRARAAYLAERFGFRPVMQEYEELVPAETVAKARLRAGNGGMRMAVSSGNRVSGPGTRIRRLFDTGAYRLATRQELDTTTPEGLTSAEEQNRRVGGIIAYPGFEREEANRWNRWAWRKGKALQWDMREFSKKYRPKGGRR